MNASSGVQPIDSILNFGLLVPGGDGHLNPSIALAAELQHRGHRVTFFAIPDTIEAGKSAELEIVECATEKLPLGATNNLLRQVAAGVPPWKISGMMQQVNASYQAYLLGIDNWLIQNPHKLDCLLLDGLSPHLFLLGEKHKIPYVVMEYTAPDFLGSVEVPPMMLGWSYSNTWWGKLRNKIVSELLNYCMTPLITGVQRRYAKAWKLPSGRGLRDSRQALLRITQIPQVFDFPRKLVKDYIYTAPWTNCSKRVKFDFPWERLNGKPIIYAALGTVYTDQSQAYQTIAKVCHQFDCQLVLSVGLFVPDNLLQNLRQTYPNFIILRKTPQVEVLKKTELFITHAGMNSTLEALQLGVPMLAVPIGGDQPGVAARIRYHQVGVSIPIKQLNEAKLSQAISRVFKNPIYTNKAKELAKKINSTPGVVLAADAIEELFKII
ncbi:glycosyltransferase, MGT family [Rivularia sp. PCC 7116]|uniref:glycosyltransferase n=1 Tax=Rivularia sp. PCC 7116 TaxID=373994 RepID=UPI00029F2E36|nr:nucleotide disphospho-sugar-binding domain-containing protein [Rivularia sp. PCC 7116]AFY55452.1 glycosyltransferase, MGT family [Rivularia sp. PCC 7116]